MLDKIMITRIQTLIKLCIQATENKEVSMQCFFDYSAHISEINCTVWENGWNPEREGVIHSARIPLDGSDKCLEELSTAINRTVIIAKKQGLKL